VGTLVLLLAAAVLIGLSMGSVPVSQGEVLSALFAPAAGDAGHVQIIREIRLPRVVLAAIVGGCLALAGAAFQGLLRNPLADPYIVGTSAGAALGASLAIVSGAAAVIPAPLAKPLFAFVGALATMYCVYRLAQVDGRVPVDTFLLAGVVVGSFLWAFVSFILAAAQGRMREIVFWLMGDLSTADPGLVWIALPYLLLGGLGLYALSHSLNLLSAGEESAAHLGVAVERTKAGVIVLASLVTAAAVSVSGLIGFMGLMVPHVARSLWGPDHRVLLPACVLAGAAFLVLADTAARVLLSPTEVPVGVITAQMGGPFFLFVLRSHRMGPR